MQWVRVLLDFSHVLVVDAVSRSDSLSCFWYKDVHMQLCLYLIVILLAFMNILMFLNVFNLANCCNVLVCIALSHDFILGILVSYYTSWKKRVGMYEQMQAFWQVIDGVRFVDLGFQGPPFTWTSSRKGVFRIKERLDHFFWNFSWNSFNTGLSISIMGPSLYSAPLGLKPYSSRPQEVSFSFRPLLSGRWGFFVYSSRYLSSRTGSFTYDYWRLVASAIGDAQGPSSVKCSEILMFTNSNSPGWGAS